MPVNAAMLKALKTQGDWKLSNLSVLSRYWPSKGNQAPQMMNSRSIITQSLKRMAEFIAVVSSWGRRLELGPRATADRLRPDELTNPTRGRRWASGSLVESG